MKIKEVITVILTLIFFGGMAALTFSAREIHSAGLPHVTVLRLTYAQFPQSRTDGDGVTVTGTRTAPAIRTSLLAGDVYVLYEREKNGEKRDFARPARIETGGEYGGFTEIISGISAGQSIVLTSDRELYDGCEVCVIK